jgi:hypothetical protein
MLRMNGDSMPLTPQLATRNSQLATRNPQPALKS